jgi:hypothetical protein
MSAAWPSTREWRPSWRPIQRCSITALANVDRWLRTTRSAALLEWRQLLETTPVTELVELLRSPSERATWLRQSSPFAGLLTPQERLTILREYESRRA